LRRSAVARETVALLASGTSLAVAAALFKGNVPVLSVLVFGGVAVRVLARLRERATGGRLVAGAAGNLRKRAPVGTAPQTL